MKTCQACGLPNINERRTCKRCGASLDEALLDGVRSPDDEWYMGCAMLAPLLAIGVGLFGFFLLAIFQWEAGVGPDQSGAIRSALSEDAQRNHWLAMVAVCILPGLVVSGVSALIVRSSTRKTERMGLIRFALLITGLEAVGLVVLTLLGAASRAGAT